MLIHASLWWCATCAISVILISLSSSQVYRREPLVTSELMSVISFAPGFILGGIAVFHIPLHFHNEMLLALFIKNLFYCVSFYFRYESLRKYGPFVGALMLGTQPILIFLLGLMILEEGLTSSQTLSVALASAALILLTKNSPLHENNGNRFRFFDFAKYFALPSLASTLAIILDRFFLRGHITSNEFFVLDRLALIPAFTLTIFAIKRGKLATVVEWEIVSPILTRNWKLLSLIGILFTFSVYSYNAALAGEKAALVGLFRNAAYPFSAFIGAFIFQKKITCRQWLSLSLILAALFLGAF